MTWTVTSDLMAWPVGTVLDAADLAGLDIDALRAAGHLAGPPCPPKPPPTPAPAATMRKLTGAAAAAVLGADR